MFYVAEENFTGELKETKYQCYDKDLNLMTPV